MNIDPIKHKNGWVIDLGMVGLEAPPQTRIDNMLRLISGQRSQKVNVLHIVALAPSFFF